MKRLIYSLFTALSLMAGGCGECPDANLDGRVDNLESRIVGLEELCEKINGNISSLQTIISVAQSRDYVTSVSEVKEIGSVVGYTITFHSHPTVTLYHGLAGTDGKNGSDGSDGEAPVVGARQDADGIYYWTLGGLWLTDESGKKIVAQGADGADGAAGADGKDGITPQFRIEDGYWYISVDNGASWSRHDRATGERGDAGADGKNGLDGANGTDGKNGLDGKPGADGKDGEDGANGADGKDGSSAFADVTVSDDYVAITLAGDGGRIIIPRQGSQLDIIVAWEGDLGVDPDQTYMVDFTIADNTDDVKFDVFTLGGVNARVSSMDGNSGVLEITTGPVVGDIDKSMDRVCMVASNGRTTAVKNLTCEKSGFVTDMASDYTVAAEGESIEVKFQTNTNYELEITPLRDKETEWIATAPESRSMREETVILNVAENLKGLRFADVVIRNKNTGEVFTTLQIGQDSPLTIAEMFPDENLSAWVTANHDTNKDGRLSLDEAMKVTSLKINTGTGPMNVTSAKGIESFPNLQTLNVQNINFGTFDGAAWLKVKSLVIKADELDLSKNMDLESFTLSKGDAESVEVDLSNNPKVKTVIVTGTNCSKLVLGDKPELTNLRCGATPISELDLSGCPNIETLFINDTEITEIDLSDNTKLSSLTCENCKIKELDLSSCCNLRSINLNNTELSELKCDIPLGTLYISDTNIADLSQVNLDKITNLRMNNTPISAIDISMLPELKNFEASNTNLSGELDFSNYGNQLMVVRILDCPNVTGVILPKAVQSSVKYSPQNWQFDSHYMVSYK